MTTIPQNDLGPINKLPTAPDPENSGRATRTTHDDAQAYGRDVLVVN